MTDIAEGLLWADSAGYVRVAVCQDCGALVGRTLDSETAEAHQRWHYKVESGLRGQFGD